MFVFGKGIHGTSRLNKPKFKKSPKKSKKTNKLCIMIKL